MNGRPRIPWPTTIVALGMALIGLAVAYGAFTNPGGFMPGADAVSTAGRAYAFAMGSRSLTMAIALLLAWLLRTPRGLIAVLAMRALTETLDLIHGASAPGANVAAAVGVVGVMILAEVAAIVQMWRLDRRIGSMAAAPFRPVAA